MSKSENNPVDPEKINILQINLIKSSIESPPDQNVDENVIDGFVMSMGNEINYSLENKMVRIRLLLNFEGELKDKGKSGLKGEFNIEYHFFVENLDDNIKKDGELFKVNKNLIATLMGMAYSTSRGIVLERTSNTAFKGLIIPIINPNVALDL